MSEIKALVVDYGGVLTVPIAETFAAWAAQEQIAPQAFVDLLLEWGAQPDNPMHQLETGHLSADDFAAAVSARIRRIDGSTLSPDGLLDRMFAGLLMDRDALVILRAARSAGLRTALLSNSWAFPYPWDDLDPLLDARVVSGEVGLRKPDPAIYHLAADQLGLPPSACAFVDDLAANVVAAQRLGMVAIQFTDLPSTLIALGAAVPALAPYLPTTPPGA